MSTTELRNSIRTMSPDAKAVVLAVEVVRDRIARLSADDREDLYALFKELVAAPSEEDRQGICDTMIEILDGSGHSISQIDLDKNDSSSEKWKKWVEWVGKRVREARKAAGLTQEELATKSGLPQSHISRLENAKHSPSRITLEKIAEAVNRPITDFDFN